MMDEVQDFLRNTVPQLPNDKISFLSTHLVTKSHHTKILHETSQNYETENDELREMLADSEKSLQTCLQLEVSQQERIQKLHESLDKSKKQHHEVAKPSQTQSLQVTSIEPPQAHATPAHSAETLERSLKTTQQQVRKFHEDVQKKETDIKAIQAKYDNSLRTMREYKKKLGVAVNATPEQVEKKILEIKEQSGELHTLKTTLRKEIEKSSNLERKLKEESRKLQHANIKYHHKEIELKQLNQMAKMRVTKQELTPRRVHLPSSVSGILPQCHHCGKPVQMTYCDICNSARLRMK